MAQEKDKHALAFLDAALFGLLGFLAPPTAFCLYWFFRIYLASSSEVSGIADARADTDFEKFDGFAACFPFVLIISMIVASVVFVWRIASCDSRL